MRYLSGTCRHGAWMGERVGLLVQPRNWRSYRAHLDTFPVWAADSGLYRKDPHGFDLPRWLEALQTGRREACLFVTARDAYCDPVTTDAFAAIDCPLIQAAGFPAAYVAQDGATVDSVPWALLDVLFVGGSTEWKLSDAARRLVEAARSRGKGTHMGRVNSERRYRLAAMWGCDSVDGTLLAFGSDANLPRLHKWVGQTVMRW